MFYAIILPVYWSEMSHFNGKLTQHSIGKIYLQKRREMEFSQNVKYLILLLNKMMKHFLFQLHTKYLGVKLWKNHVINSVEKWEEN